MVAIKGLEMPKSCSECPLFHFYLDTNGTIHFICKYGNMEMCGDLKNKRNDFCPLVESEEKTEGSTYGGVSWGGTYKPQEQEPFMNKPCVAHQVCHEDKIKVLDKIRAEIKEWYWQADKQALAKDPCVVDAMVDLFIRTIDKYKGESEG